MARMRFAVYHAAYSLPATGSMVVNLMGLLRDILPDKAFRVHTVSCQVRMSSDPGDVAYIWMAKNITPAPASLADGIIPTHGMMVVKSFVKAAGSAVMEGQTWEITWPQPLDFDADDSLNLTIGASNAAATIQTLSADVVVTYD